MIPIFLPSDNNYAPYLAALIASILDNTKSFIDFYILDSGISEENKKKILELKNKFDNFRISFIKINLNADFSDFKTKGYLNNSTYSRFLIPEYSEEFYYKKIIYLDSDMIVLCDINNLFNIDLEDKILGAVYDWSLVEPSKDKFITIGIKPEDKYFNTGTLLIDNEKWTHENIKKKLFEIEKEYREKLLYADMDVFNICFKNNYKNLPEKYNLLAHVGALKDDVEGSIIHFNGKIKPWMINENSEASFLPVSYKYFWKYLKMTNFYNEIYEKTLDINEQKEYMHRLKLEYLVFKASMKKLMT